MESPSAQLSSIICGHCKICLLELFEEENKTKYKCQCGRTSRIILECVYCHKLFPILPYLIRKSNFCSRRCYWTGTNGKQLRICRGCHKEFYAKAHLLKKGYGLYCSRECWFSIFTRWKKKIRCKQCKKEFQVLRSVYKKRPKFCSKGCKDDFERDYVSKVCHGCKKSFELPRSGVNRGRGSFCSWECYKKYQGETSIEKRVRLELKKLNEPFKQEFRFGRFRADFFLPDKKVVIECDGDYWHRSEKIKERDKRKDKYLEELGYKVIRLSEDKIKKNASEALQELCAP